MRAFSTFLGNPEQVDAHATSSHLMAAEERSNGTGNRLRRFFFRYVLAPLVGAVTVAVLGWIWSSSRGLFAMPRRLIRVENYIVVDSTEKVKDRRLQAGMLSAMCFGLSDSAFAASRDMCGEAFIAARVINGERMREKAKP
jgi:hypothetical protein